MKRFFALVAAAAALCSLSGGAARAIIGGTLDAGAHPYVVLLKIAQTNAPTLRCTGVLVNGSKVITAAHCLDATTPTGIGVFFGDGPYTTETPDATSTGYVIKPGYVGLDTPKKADTHDLAVVTIAASHNTSPQPTIAAENYSDALPKKYPFTVVGYGLQSVRPWIAERTRYEATSDLKSTKDPFNLRISNKDGGACFGDSGGPVLDGNVVVAILSTTQNTSCTGSSYGYRLDTADSRAFLAVNGALV